MSVATFMDASYPHLFSRRFTSSGNTRSRDMRGYLEFDGNTVLCRVCGDKASGFHYGVHACEGCKGFFRRSIQQKIQYRPCLKNQQCNIMRVNRNRCQYCRLKKCIAVGMSRDAVRFGRVPKKEKEKIMEQMQRVSNQSQLSALNHVLSNCRLGETIISAYRDTWGNTQQTLHRTCDWSQQAETQMYCPLQQLNPSTNGQAGTSHYSDVIRNVVEFAKGIPGFDFLSQDDQGTLLKAGTFEVVLVWLSRLYNASANTIMYLNGRLSTCPLNSSSSSFLIEAMFGFANQLSGYNLTEEETALFSALVLLAPDRPGLRNPDTVDRIQQQIIGCLGDLMSPQGPDLQGLLLKIPDIRTLNTLHSEKVVCQADKSSTISRVDHKLGSTKEQKQLSNVISSTSQRCNNIPSPCLSEPGPLMNDQDYEQVVPLVRRYTMPSALGRPVMDVTRQPSLTSESPPNDLTSGRFTVQIASRPERAGTSVCSSPGVQSERPTGEGTPVGGSGIRKRSRSDAELLTKSSSLTPPHSEHGVALKKRKYIKNWNEGTTESTGCRGSWVDETAPAVPASRESPVETSLPPQMKQSVASRCGPIQDCISKVSPEHPCDAKKNLKGEHWAKIKPEIADNSAEGMKKEISFQTLAEWAIRKELMAVDEPRSSPVMNIQSRLELYEQEKRRLPLHGIHSILERLGDSTNMEARYTHALAKPEQASIHRRAVSHLKDTVLRRIDSMENLKNIGLNKLDVNKNLVADMMHSKSSSLPNVSQPRYVQTDSKFKAEALMNLRVMSPAYGQVASHAPFMPEPHRLLPMSSMMGLVDTVAVTPTYAGMNGYQWSRDMTVPTYDEEPLNLTTK